MRSHATPGMLLILEIVPPCVARKRGRSVTCLRPAGDPLRNQAHYQLHRGVEDLGAERQTASFPTPVIVLCPRYCGHGQLPMKACLASGTRRR